MKRVIMPASVANLRVDVLYRTGRQIISAFNLNDPSFPDPKQIEPESLSLAGP
jgi:hypothetical protein